MANTLSVYDPLFYAQEALTLLYKSLGMAGRVYRGYDRAPREKGSTVSIRVPGTFVAQDAPSSGQDINAAQIQVAMKRWREVKFGLTDAELAYTQQQIIDEHVAPAAFALADDIDQYLISFASEIPWTAGMAGATADVKDLTKLRSILFANRNPMNDGNLHFMIDGQTESELLALAAFSQFQGAGPEAAAAQQRGSLGQKFGLEVFANQNEVITSGGVAGGSTPTVNTAGALKGATSLPVTGFGASGTFAIGDVFSIAGDPQEYAVTAPATMSTSAGTLAIYPALSMNHVSGDAIVVLQKAAGHTVEGLAFHRDFMALAMCPLSDIGGQLGAKIATVEDPVTNLTLRSRLFYDGPNSKVYVALDVLYGAVILNPNRAVRFQR